MGEKILTCANQQAERGTTLNDQQDHKRKQYESSEFGLQAHQEVDDETVYQGEDDVVWEIS